MTNSAHWKPIDAGLYLGEYLFGSNVINTVVVDMGGGNLAVISPGTNVTDDVFEELDKLGAVTAIVSPGAFHNMGFPLWHARYPKAGLYATQSGIARIAKKHPSLPPVKSYDELQALMSDDIKLYETPSKSHGDLLMFVTRGEQVTMYTNELITNNAELPKNLLFKVMFKLTKSGPGLCFSNLSCKLTGANRKTASAFISERIVKHGLTRFLPCHGAVADGPGTRQRVEAALAVAAR